MMSGAGYLASWQELRKHLYRSKEEARMFPARFAAILLGFILSGFMSAMVSGIATWRAYGMANGFAADWFGAWVMSWAIAFPAVLVPPCWLLPPSRGVSWRG
jgi:hypothetical protein